MPLPNNQTLFGPAEALAIPAGAAALPTSPAAITDGDATDFGLFRSSPLRATPAAAQATTSLAVFIPVPAADVVSDLKRPATGIGLAVNELEPDTDERGARDSEPALAFGPALFFDELDGAGPDDDADDPAEPVVSAKATAGRAATTAPTPNASAKAPIRPTPNAARVVQIGELCCCPAEFTDSIAGIGPW